MGVRPSDLLALVRQELAADVLPVAAMLVAIADEAERPAIETRYRRISQLLALASLPDEIGLPAA
jgi:hypothetical protein